MKLNKFFMLGLAGLAFAACSNDDELGNGLPDDNTPKTLIVSIKGLGDASTRATMDAGGAIWTEDANAAAAQGNIQNLAFFFTDAAGAVKYKYQISKEMPDGTEEAAAQANTKKWSALFGTTGAKFVGLTGVSAVHIVANAIFDTDEFKDIANISSLNTTLAQQAPSIVRNAVVYVGSDKEVLKAVHTEPAAATEEITLEGADKEGSLYYNAVVELKPIISRIQITSIKVQTTGKILFPAEVTTAGGVEAAKEAYAIPWENFKPVLHGIYLNRFADSFNDLLGEHKDMKDTDTYVDTIKDGTWSVGGTDKKTEAAYINYNSDSGEYGTLLPYVDASIIDGIAELIPTATENAQQKCIAFNVLVPFATDAKADATTGVAGSDIANPTIHFQFDKDMTPDYAILAPTMADGDAIEADSNDETFVEAYTKEIASLTTDYTLPTTDEYLFANINKLYSDTEKEVELELQPGKIYNMEVLITPVNMSIDLRVPKSYNVVVKVSVVPFKAVNIYPGLDE